MPLDHSPSHSVYAVQALHPSRDQECGRYGAWHVVATEWNEERLAAASVRAAGFQVFLPLIRRRLPRTDARPARNEVEIAFRGYLFAMWSPTDPWGRVKAAKGVAGILHAVGDRDRPATVPAAFMGALLASASALGILEDRSDPDLLPPLPQGSAVRITCGPFAGRQALVELSTEERVRLLLDALGARVVMRRDQVVTDAS